uniref:DNA excision repair protein ERCC-8 n=1 Tax=Peronospora matthiolae TaxID=2874970 RepID=A0AAV1UP54_9STRA
MTSAFEYLVDRSVGLPSCAYRDNLHARHSRELLQLSPTNYIFRQGMRVWSCALDPTEHRYLLIGTAQSQLVLFDLETLDDADRTGTPTYNTMNPLSPISIARAPNGPSLTHGLQLGISMVDWYPVDSGLCITSSFDGHVQVWDAERLSCVSTFPLRRKVFGAKFSPSGTTHTLVAAATANGEVRLVDIASHATAHSLLGHKDEVWTLDWAPGSEFTLVTGSRDGEIRLWDIRRSGATACLLCFDYQGHASVPGRSSLYTNIQREKGPMSLTAAATAATRNKRRRVGGGASEVQLRERHRVRVRVESHRESMQKVTALQQKRNDPHAAATTSLAVAHNGGVTSLAYTPDGRFLLSRGMDNKLRLWNATSGEHQFMNYHGVQRAQPRAARNIQMAIAQEGGAYETTVVFVPNGADGALASYRVFGESGVPLGSATAHYQQVTACLYRKSTRELYSAGEDGLIMKWKPPPVDLYPQVPEDVSGDVQTISGGSTADASAAIGDTDAWSDDEQEETNHRFIPPILRDDI